MVIISFSCIPSRILFGVVLIIFSVIHIIKCNENGKSNTTSTTTNKPPPKKELDYDAIIEKLLELKKMILGGLESIKQLALEDRSNLMAGHEIAEMIKKAKVVVDQTIQELENMAKDKTFTRKTAKIPLRKVEKEMTALKNNIIKEVEKLSSESVIKILNTAIDCYQNVLKLINDLNELLDD